MNSMYDPLKKVVNFIFHLLVPSDVSYVLAIHDFPVILSLNLYFLFIVISQTFCSAVLSLTDHGHS